MPYSPGTKQEEAGRFEFKYRLALQDYQALRNAIIGYMRRDEYTRRGGSKGYLVRSLYFETMDFSIYAQKMAGDHARVKYRLRSYSADPAEEPPVRVELKVRRGESLFKYQAFISYRQYLQFLLCRGWGDGADHPVLEEFARGLHLEGLRPCILVDYHREGYASRGGDGVRLTFDHAVRSAQADALFPDPEPFFRVHHPGEIVLEIKYRNAAPAWLALIVRGHGLRLVANSKFTQGVEVGRRDRFYPQGVLTVR